MSIPLDKLKSTLDRSINSHIAHTIVNAPFEYRFDTVSLGIGIIVFLVADERDGQIHRIALSRTDMASGTIRMSDKEFREIRIPLDHLENIIAKAIHDRQPHSTEDWRYLFTPSLSPEQARMNQAGGSIACSFVYPLDFGNESGGALIFSYYKYFDKIGNSEREFMAAYSELVSKRLADCSAADFVTG